MIDIQRIFTIGCHRRTRFSHRLALTWLHIYTLYTQHDDDVVKSYKKSPLNYIYIITGYDNNDFLKAMTICNMLKFKQFGFPT